MAKKERKGVDEYTKKRMVHEKAYNDKQKAIRKKFLMDRAERRKVKKHGE